MGKGERRQKIKYIGSGEPSAIGLDSLCLFINVCVSVLYIFMYRRPILCTLYDALDFLNVLKKYIMYL
jgi:hypothetical protein